jgi:phage N-6-adenine-methyltransferase
VAGRRIYKDNAARQRAYRRRQKASRLQVHFSSLLDVRETPQDLFGALDAEFGFGTDVCALPSNAKCPHYFSPEEDGLSQEWRGACFMNPPYGSQIGAWVEKAWRSAHENGATVVCVLPSRTDAHWFHEYVMRAERRYLRGRVRFGGSEGSAPFPTLVAVFGPGVEPRCLSWIWKLNGAVEPASDTAARGTA